MTLIFNLYLAVLIGSVFHLPDWYMPGGAHPPQGCHWVQHRVWKRALLPAPTKTLLCWQDGRLQHSEQQHGEMR